MAKRLAMSIGGLAGRADARAGAQMNGAAELVARVQRGDDEAFRLIFERYSRPVTGFIRAMLGARAQAEDFMQETFARAYKNIHTLQDGDKLSTWLFGIARNVAREALRAQGRAGHRVALDDAAARRLSDAATPPDSELLRKELHQVILAALEKLSEDKRTVFVLKVFHQRSYDEIAQITGFSMAKLKADLHRARAEMRSMVRPYMEVSDEV